MALAGATLELAIEAYAVVEEYRENWEMPEGWSMVGSGSFRTAVMHDETGIVYKVEDWRDDPDYSNRGEYETAEELRQIAWERVRIPDVVLFDTEHGDVLAMEYVSGTMGTASPSSEFREARKEMFEKGRLVDMHGDNFLFDDDGYLVPVDLASPIADPDERPWEQPDASVLTCGDGMVGGGW